MNFSAAAFIGGADTQGNVPETYDYEMEIPGFPKPPSTKQRIGYAANLQGHLEKLAANAASVSHVLEALCGGLDRLEQKIDANTSQMEARLSNIVHHVTGEADEETMSAWGSLGGGSPGGDSSLACRRGSFGVGIPMTSFHGDPLFELDEVGQERPLSEERSDGMDFGGGQLGSVVAQAVAVKDKPVVTADGLDVDGDLAAVEDGQTDGVADDGNAGEDGKKLTPEQSSTGPENGAAEGGSTAASSHAKRPEGVEIPVPQSARRRSNQDDQSQGSENNNNNTGVDATAGDRTRGVDEAAHQPQQNAGIFSQSPDGLEQAGEDTAKDIDLSESIGSSSDGRLIARQRWMWAFGRVCRLIRRRKRQQFEIMNQRATDRAVRMGSRVSIVEKRLDETHDALVGVERLRAKNTAHAYEIKCLHSKVAELSALVGMEERVQGLVKVTQDHMEGMVKNGDLGVEIKLRSGHEELESRLESEMKRHDSRLEDMDDRYARNDEAVRRAEDRLGEMQEEVNTVTHSITELERQLRVDEERLDSLESAKKAQQRRLSDMRQRVENSDNPSALVGNNHGMLELEAPEETAAERMSRLLKAAATTLEFLSADLDKIVGKLASAGDDTASTGAVNAPGGPGATDGALDNDQNGEHSMGAENPLNLVQLLREISDHSAEYASRCWRGNNWEQENEGGGGMDGRTGSRGGAVQGAEELCARIESLLDVPGLETTGPSLNGQSKSTGGFVDLNGSVRISEIQCPNGHRELPATLKAARDVLLPIVEEGSSVGALRVALLGLKADLDRALGGGRVEEDAGEEGGSYSTDSRWRDLEGRLSMLNVTLADMKENMYERGMETDRNISADIDSEDLDDRLVAKADASWVQRELQRLWDALHSRAMPTVASSSGVTSFSGQESTTRPASAPPSKGPSKETPETAGEESDSSPPSTPPVTSDSGMKDGGAKEVGPGMVVPPTGTGRRSSFNEGSPLIKDLLRKTSRLDQQMSSKADNEEVMRALSSIGNKLRKLSSTIPGLEDALTQKVERKDITKLAALISGGNVDPSGNNDEKNPSASSSSAVLASRLNSKFRCLSCDRPLPAIGPPGPPKFGAKGLLAIGSSGKPPSPQRYGRPGSRGGGGIPKAGVGTVAGPGSPENGGGVVGWGDGSSTRATTPPKTTDGHGDIVGSPSTGTSKDATTAWKQRGGNRTSTAPHSEHHQQQQQQQQHTGRLEPIGANAPGEQIAGVMSRYPRMMPPPNRIRTAAGGGGAGLGTRPGSSGRF